MAFWSKERFKNDWQQVKKQSQHEYEQKHQKKIAHNQNGKKTSYAQSKTHKIILSFTYAITVPFLGLIVGSMFGDAGATIGWFIAGVIGFTGLVSVWKR